MTIQLARVGGILDLPLVNLHLSIATKGWLARQHLEHHDAKRIDVGATVGPMTLAGGLFGRHIAWSAQYLTIYRHRYLADFALRKTKIHEHRLPRFVHHDIRWF